MGSDLLLQLVDVVERDAGRQIRGLLSDAEPMEDGYPFDNFVVVMGEKIEARVIWRLLVLVDSSQPRAIKASALVSG